MHQKGNNSIYPAPIKTKKTVSCPPSWAHSGHLYCLVLGSELTTAWAHVRIHPCAWRLYINWCITGMQPQSHKAFIHYEQCIMLSVVVAPVPSRASTLSLPVLACASATHIHCISILGTLWVAVVLLPILLVLLALRASAVVANVEVDVLCCGFAVGLPVCGS